MSTFNEDYETAMQAMKENYDKAMQALEDAQDKGVVLGLDGLGLGPVERLDIDVLMQKYPDTFNLYLLALEEMSKKTNDHKMSYYEIAGT